MEIINLEGSDVLLEELNSDCSYTWDLMGCHPRWKQSDCSISKKNTSGNCLCWKDKDWRINTISNCTAHIFLYVKPSGSDEAATEAVRGDAGFDLFLGNRENVVEELVL